MTAMEEVHEWDLLPDDLFNLLSYDMSSDDPNLVPGLLPTTPCADGTSSSTPPTSQQDLASRTKVIGVPKPMLGGTPKVPGKDERVMSPIVDRICQARSRIAAPRTGPELQPRMQLNLCHAALGPGTWSPLSRPLIFENRVIVGTETAQVRGPENYRNTTGLIFCEMEVSWGRGDSSRPMHADTEFVGTETAIQDIQWLKPGESCVYATESELSICGFNRRKHVIETRESHDRIRQLAVSHERLVTGGFDEKVCLYGLSEGRRNLSSCWELNGIVGGISWHPADVNLLTYTLDHGEFGLIDVRSNAADPAVRCDFGRGCLYAHCAVSDVVVSLGYGSGYGCLMDLRRAAGIPLDVWKDPCLTAIGEFIDSSCCGITSQNFPPLTIAAGIGGLTVWDFTNGEAKCLGQGSPLGEYKDFPFPRMGFKTSGVFVPDQEMVYAQTDAAGYLSLYDVGSN